MQDITRRFAGHDKCFNRIITRIYESSMDTFCRMQFAITEISVSRVNNLYGTYITNLIFRFIYAALFITAL